MVSAMGLVCGQTYSFSAVPRGTYVSVSHPEWLISNRRKWEEVDVDSKQATVGSLKEGIFWEPVMVNVRQELVFHANQTVPHSGMRLAPSVGQQEEQALSAAVYVKEQTWKGLFQN